MEYLYNDGDDYYFMDESFEQTMLKRETLGDAVDYLLPNLTIAVSFHDGKAVGIELPMVVEMTVVETEPGIKSATASSVTKPAKLETGLVVQVPPFINEGEKIRVDTAEGAYMSRAEGLFLSKKEAGARDSAAFVFRSWDVVRGFGGSATVKVPWCVITS